MKKFSNITGQKIAQEPKVEIKITESDVFKSKVLELMDNLLKVQIYGPVTRYHVAGNMKVAGKELFLEALMDLLDDKSNVDKVKLLESLKYKINDWKAIDETIDQIKSEPTGLYKHRSMVKSMYNKYKNDKDLLIEQCEKSANKIKTAESVFLRHRACESLLSDSNFNPELIKRMSETYLNKLNNLEYELNANGGEKLESYVDRLLDFYQEVSRNKLASYAALVNNKRSVVVGEFNGVKIVLDRPRSKNELIEEIRSKM